MSQIIDPTIPLDSDLLSAGAGTIRDTRQNIIDILGVGHDVTASPATSTGKALTSHSWHDALANWAMMRSG